MVFCCKASKVCFFFGSHLSCMFKSLSSYCGGGSKILSLYDDQGNNQRFTHKSSRLGLVFVKPSLIKILPDGKQVSRCQMHKNPFEKSLSRPLSSCISCFLIASSINDVPKEASRGSRKMYNFGFNEKVQFS